MEAICSSETSVETQRTKRRHIKNSIVLHVSTARQQLARVLYRLHGELLDCKVVGESQWPVKTKIF
jgi:hypothetical protein